MLAERDHVHRVASSRALSASSAQQEVASPPRRLLLAEDDWDLRELLSMVFEEGGWDVVGVTNGVRALEELREHAPRFRVAVLAARMPAMTGLDVLREARRLDIEIPVVLVTSFVDSQLRERAAKLGTAYVIATPLEPELLRNVVDMAAATTHDQHHKPASQPKPR